MKPILTTAEVAALLECSEETVEIAARDGRLPGVKYGRAWVFPLQALCDALNAEAAAQRPAPPSPAAVAVSADLRRQPAANSPMGTRARPRPDLSSFG